MNKLHLETSPYLLQHAHNPVHWQTWSETAFQQARQQDKPLIISIGYATCHWCHVMERESFEDQNTADYMNQHFICVKIDREERPDVDSVYMDALQAMGVSGGWPLNVFLLPDGRPFYGGTYFPPAPAYGRQSWLEVLARITDVYTNHKKVVLDNAIRLTNHIANIDTAFLKRFQTIENQEFIIAEKNIQNAFENLTQQFDEEEGGFGAPPKFLATMAIQFLLEYSFFYKENKAENTKKAQQHALISIQKMSRGGLYDHLQGGFSRYSTDRVWLVPHFEKMLYDNALIINNLVDCLLSFQKDKIQETEKNENEKQTHQKKELNAVLDQTINYIQKIMTSPEGAFYTAEDADSNGVEGEFYVWQKNQITAAIQTFFQTPENINLLKNRHLNIQKIIDLFCEFYNISTEGNWEQTNILNTPKPFYEFCESKNIVAKDFLYILEKIKSYLCTTRAKRTKPLRDEKIILGWNALLAKAILKASYLQNNQNYRQIAQKNIDFLLANFRKENTAIFYHTGVFIPNKEKKTTSFSIKNAEQAFLDDYAYLIDTLLENNNINDATIITNYLLQEFFDAKSGLFFYTNSNTNLILRKKDYYDGAMPSGNATMALNLLKLAILLDNNEYKQIAVRMVQNLQPAAEKFPLSFARWLEAAQRLATPFVEVAIVGKNAEKLAAELRQHYVPHLLLQYATVADPQFPLLRNRQPNNENLTYIYVCQNYTCQQPVQTVQECLQSMQELYTVRLREPKIREN